jgi:hypothetical protein
LVRPHTLASSIGCLSIGADRGQGPFDSPMPICDRSFV